MMKSITLFILLNSFLNTAQAKSCDPKSFLENVFTPEASSVEMKMISADLRTMDKSLINETLNEKKFAYWIDDQDQIQFSNIDQLPGNGKNLTLLKDKKTGNGFAIKESGEFYYDPSKKEFIFKAKNSIDLQPGEIDEVIKKQTSFNFKREINPEFEKTRVMKCSQTMAADLRGDSFIKDGMISSFSVTSAAFAISNPQILNPKDKDWNDKALLFTSDITGNLASSYVSGKVVKPLLSKDVGLIRDFTQRTATDFATNTLIKRPIYNVLIPNKKEDEEKTKLGTKLIPYDTGFSVVRFFPKRAVQRWTVNELPKIMLATCLKNSNAQFIIGPRMVRVVDQFGWGLIYQNFRKVYLDQVSEENKK
jgi:hypothetical protein